MVYHATDIFPSKRIRLLSVIARLLRIQFKIDGIPYGAKHRHPGCYQFGASTSDD